MYVLLKDILKILRKGHSAISPLEFYYDKTASLVSFARCGWMRDRAIARAIG